MKEMENKLQSQIDLWADKLTMRISEIKMMDIDQMKLSISTYIKMALHDCLKIEISDLERELNQQKFIYQNFKGDSRHIMAKIIDIKSKIKERNVMNNQIEQNEKLAFIINFIGDHYPEIRPLILDKWDKNKESFSSIHNL
jgi:hypothetical protein